MTTCVVDNVYTLVQLTPLTLVTPYAVDKVNTLCNWHCVQC